MGKNVVFYISGHGFGHAARSAEVVRALRERAPEAGIAVRSSAPEWFLREQGGKSFSYRRRDYDPGVVQADSLTILYRRTLDRLADFLEAAPALIEEEAAFVRGFGAGVVVGDIPHLAFEIAERAGVPSLALANFSWDWIYEPYLERLGGRGGELETIRAGYGKAGLLLRLPFSRGLEAFPRQEPIPLIGRPSRFDRPGARKALGIDPGAPVVLLSFGGFSLDEALYRAMSADRGLVWLASERVGAGVPGIRNVSREELQARGLGYPDLVRAADVVATKPGYGILSECIANRTRMLYTDRGEFREYPVLVEGARASLPCRHIGADDLRAGKLGAAARDLLAQPDDFADVPLNGAEVAAARILAQGE